VTGPNRFRAYAIAVLGVALATLAGELADGRVTLADQAMLYLPAILVAALGGRSASLAAAALSVAAFDFFFVPPRLTFAVNDARSLITFAVMFGVGTAIGSLVARLRTAEAASRERERRTAALLAFTRDAAAASEVGEVLDAARRHVAELRDDQAFVDSVGHQAEVAVSRLELATAAREAALRAKAEELRSTLLSSVSHDLRTPLAAITGMATSLRDLAGDRSAEEREALDTIVEEAQRLSRILTNLLSITKVESGAAPRREWVPLEEIIGSALTRLEHELADHPVSVDVPDGALAHVDPILVEQLLLNLLENAAKHTPPGTAIDVRVAREPGRAVLEIADRGPGVPAGARVFDKFVRGKTSAPGAGLGLAVCRGIAVAHHGDIDVTARDGGGAAFAAWFPDEGPLPDPLDDEAEAS
jgi:K+-sensing histidine kinase KdpD